MGREERDVVADGNGVESKILTASTATRRATVRAMPCSVV